MGILTASDSSARGGREDRSGKVIREMVEAAGAEVGAYAVVPDEAEEIRARLREMTDTLGLDVVLTTGGTGLGPRDVTPEATLSLIEREVPGIPEAMRLEGLKKTPLAEFANVRRSGLIALDLDPGDELIGVRLTDGRCHVMLVTQQGLAIRFAEDEVRPMGRGAAGVRRMPTRETTRTTAPSTSPGETSR